MNSAHAQVVALKLSVPFFFILFTRSVHPVPNRAKTIKLTSFGNRDTSILCISARMVAWGWGWGSCSRPRG